MAKKEDETLRQSTEKLKGKSSIVTYGTDTTLDTENDSLKNVIQQTILDTKTKLGERTNGKPINYFNEINFGNAFSELFIDKNNGKEGKSSEKIQDTTEFKKFMETRINANSALLQEDVNRSIAFNNYRIIYKHIPECAQALNIYKDNIMSPDDYTKLIFDVHYDKSIGSKLVELIDARLDSLTEKYQLEIKADKIIGESLLLGESYVAVLSLEDELGTMLNDPIYRHNNKVLNEDVIRSLDIDCINTTILSESLNVGEKEVAALNECLGITEENNMLNENDTRAVLAKMINENIEIGSAREFLLERFEADQTLKGTDIPDSIFGKKTKKSSKSSDNKLMYINGSSIRQLEPSKVIELAIDDVCYGYYYVEDNGYNLPLTSYLGVASGRSIQGSGNIAANNTLASTTSGSYTSANSAAGQLNVGENKLKLISNIFLDAIAQKVDKEFIRKNKKFKDFIYELVKQDYIIKKGIKLTYFAPNEVIKFECDPVYRDITFFAKLYLAILTNNLIIKLGRAHDKRVLYVNVGADAQYEQAIQSVIEDIKTKDYKMESLNDFNTVLNLNPGRFDDYVIPTVNGDKPVEIETLQGMDVDMNNEFVEYLKNSMMSGMGVPRNLIDTTSEVDFARTLSSMNSNFVRSVIRYQKKLTPSFTRLYQILYRNEYKYANDKEVKADIVDISSIKVEFPSPATLAMTNMMEQLQSADQYADFISNTLVQVSQMDGGKSEMLKVDLKSKIIKDKLPGIDWAKYEQMKEQSIIDMEKKAIDDVTDPNMNPQNPSGMIGGY